MKSRKPLQEFPEETPKESQMKHRKQIQENLWITSRSPSETPDNQKIYRHTSKGKFREEFQVKYGNIFSTNPRKNFMEESQGEFQTKILNIILEQILKEKQEILEGFPKRVPSNSLKKILFLEKSS